MTDSPAIAVRGLSKSFRRHHVLTDLDLHVERGTVFGLLGPNGAGKTTTIGVLTTLVRPDAGSIRVAGVDVVANPVAATERFSLTGQAAAVDDMLTGRENLVMLGRLRGLSRGDARLRAQELLERFALTDAAARRVATYSGGMRRRLDLALSFVVTPEVLFLDEPTTGLDARSRRELWAVIRTLADAGTTVFLTTQYLEEADQLADRIAVLDGGRVVAEGTALQLKSQIGTARVEVRSPAGAILATRPTDGTVAGLRRVLDDLDAAGITGDITVHRPTLDDAFLALTSPPAPARPARAQLTDPQLADAQLADLRESA